MNFEAYYKITYGLYVVSTVSNKKLNGYVSNTVFQVTSDPAQFAIACSKNNHTAGMIIQSNVFAISALQKDTKANIMGTFGFKTGNDIDKFAKVNYKIGKTGAPILLDSTLAWFECEVVQTIDAGSHLLFIGKVVDGDLLNGTDDPLTYAYYRDIKKGKAPKNAPTYIDAEKMKQQTPTLTADLYKCTACGNLYDPKKGDPDAGIAPGTRFEDLPDNWVCPVCGVDKDFFVKKE